LATLIAVAARLVFVLAASTAPLPGSNFEIDDGNLRVDGAPPTLDWANVSEQRKADIDPGPTHDSFGQGAKEDTAVPTIVDRSILAEQERPAPLRHLPRRERRRRLPDVLYTETVDIPAGTASLLTANKTNDGSSPNDYLATADATVSWRAHFDIDDPKSATARQIRARSRRSRLSTDPVQAEPVN
jgi:hypothetical protein